MITYRTAFAGAGVLAVVAVLVLLLAPAARADDAQLRVGLSAEGPFSLQLSGPLFRKAGPLVPGDTVARTVWVQNDSEHASRSTVWLQDSGTTSRLERRLGVAVDVGGVRSEGRFPRGGGRACHLATTGPTIPAGAAMPVELGIAIPDVAGQMGMAQLASFDVHISLGQVGPSGEVAVCGAQATGEGGDGPAGAGSVDRGSCERDVVVTTSGTPTCVPTVVAAGAAGGFGGGELGHDGTWALLGLALGTGLVLGARRRRPAPRHRAG